MTEELGSHLAFPTLYGAPAYARPPKVIADAPRPVDADDLPLELERTEEERTLAARIGAPGSSRRAANPRTAAGGGGAGSAHGAAGSAARSATAEPGMTAHRLSLRAMTDRFRGTGR